MLSYPLFKFNLLEFCLQMLFFLSFSDILSSQRPWVWHWWVWIMIILFVALYPNIYILLHFIFLFIASSYHLCHFIKIIASAMLWCRGQIDLSSLPVPSLPSLRIVDYSSKFDGFLTHQNVNLTSSEVMTWKIKISMIFLMAGTRIPDAAMKILDEIEHKSAPKSKVATWTSS